MKRGGNKGIISLSRCTVFLECFQICAKCSFSFLSRYQAFPEATNLQIVHSSQYLTSTLHIPHTSHPHTGTYHCYVVDGTAENVEVWSRPPFACKVRHMCRGSGPPCQAFITASNPATVTVIGQSSHVTPCDQ